MAKTTLNQNEIKKRIKQYSKEDENIVVTSHDGYIEIYDEENVDLKKYYNPKREISEILEIGNSKIDKEKLMEYLNVLDKDLFMTIDKIYLISNQEDLDKFYKDYPEQFLELMENHSIYSYMNNVIAVSIESIAENVKNMIELELVEYVNSDSQNSIFILVEIIRMLRSSMILNSLLTKEELMSDIGGDENFSAYARFELTKIIGKKGEINYITKES